MERLISGVEVHREMQNTLKKFDENEYYWPNILFREENNVYLSNVKRNQITALERYIDDFVEKRLSGTAAIRNVHYN